MKKGINFLFSFGLILSVIGIVFGLKSKLFDNNLEVYTNGNSVTYAGNKVLKVNKGKTGKINILLNTSDSGFYSYELNLPESIELYYDRSMEKKVNKLYKIYNENNNRERVVIYYKNTGDNYQGNLNLSVKRGDIGGTILNKASSKDLFWSDEYRSLIENVEFLYDEDYKCLDNCFNLSSNVFDVYGELILKDGKYDLKIVSDSLIYLPNDSSYMFDDFDSLKSIKFNNVSSQFVNNMSYMFSNNDSLEFIDLSDFDTSNVKNMSGLFRNDVLLKEIDLSSFVFNDDLEYNYIFKNIDSESIVYVKSSFEQAFVFGLNVYIRPGTWTVSNIIVK